MLKMKRAAAVAAFCAAAVSPTALAGWSGNVGAVSEYMFRGIGQGGGGEAAVQGGIDWAGDSGVYVGTWASNIGFGGGYGGTEQDFYVGFSGEAGSVSFDLGALYYWYPEEDEVDAELSTLEFYASIGFGPVSLGYAYSDETNFFIGDGNGEAAGYLSASLELPITEMLAFTASIGQYSGDEIERVLGSEDSYIDYSIGLSVSLEGGWGASFQYIATDLEEETWGYDDEPKFVVGLSYGFDLL